MRARTHYETLGLPQDASTVAVRKAYLRLAHQLHPDRNRAPDAAARFAEVANAYNVLISPERRALYDAEMRSGLKAPPSIRLPQSIVDPAQELVVNTLHETAGALTDQLTGLAARSGLLGQLAASALLGAADTLRARAEERATQLAERLRGKARR
ncbi:MAG: J domain-containing protein [Polyangia bacterium]